VGQFGELFNQIRSSDECDEAMLQNEPTHPVPVMSVSEGLADEQGRPVASLCLDGGECGELILRYEEVCAFLAQVGEVRAQLEWAKARWIYARGLSSKKPHLMRRGEHGAQEAALCGQRSPAWAGGWDLSPVLEAPREGCCLRCLAGMRRILAGEK
jgi:hypothetical protein